MDRTREAPLIGIALKLAATAVLMAMISIVKWATEALPPGQLVFFRSAFALPVIIAWLALRGDLRRGLRTRNPLGHLWRGIIGTSGMAAGFTAFGLLPMPDVVAIQKLAPLLVVVFAALFLGERVRAVRLGAVLLGFLGVIIVMWPQLTLGAEGAVLLGTIVALISAATMALAQVTVRHLAKTEDTAAIVFWFSTLAAVLALATAPFGWVWPSREVWALMLVAGLLGGFGQILLTASYRFADASVIAPFDYSAMLMAVVIGWAVFEEVPTATTLLGSGLLIAAGLVIIWRERQLGLKRGVGRATTPRA